MLNIESQWTHATRTRLCWWAHEWIDGCIGNFDAKVIFKLEHNHVAWCASSMHVPRTHLSDEMHVSLRNNNQKFSTWFSDGHCRRCRIHVTASVFGTKDCDSIIINGNEQLYWSPEHAVHGSQPATAHKIEWVILKMEWNASLSCTCCCYSVLLLWWSIIACKYIRLRISMKENGREETET